MRALRLAVAPFLGLCMAAACSSQDSGLLDLTLTADTQNPPPQAVAVDLIGSGGIHKSYPGKFPPDGATFLRLEYPDLPAGTITLTVQTLDSKGCVLGESPAPFTVAIKAGAKVAAATTIQKSTKGCGDGGGPAKEEADAGVDAGRAGGDVGGFDGGSLVVDSPTDTLASVDTAPDVPATDAPLPDVLSADAALFDAHPADRPSDVASVDSSQAVDSPASGADAPSAPIIVSFTASPSTISAGSAATLTAIFKNATGSSVDHGIGSVTSGNGVGTGALTANTTYTLTVIDAAGASVSQQVTVTVVPRPTITSFTALLPTIAVGTLTQLTASFTGESASIDNNIGVVTSGTPVPTGVLTANTTFTLTVTNAAGDSVTRQATVAVSAAVGTGTFLPAKSMSVARSGHTATLLANGKVLVAGGSGDSSAELYDPTSGIFTPTKPMIAARNGSTATLLGNGKVLVAGGDIALRADQPSTGELYDPSTDTFAPAGAQMTNRYDSAASSLPSGEALFLGGEYGTDAAATAETYDPASGKFSPTKNMTAGRQNPTATLLQNGQVLVTGGYYLIGVALSPYRATAEIYDPKMGSFALTAGQMAVGRAASTATLLQSGKVLVVGGVGDSGELTSTELYDQFNNTFTVSGATTDARYWHTATLLPSGKVLVAGGDLLSSAELYDPTTGQFAPANDMSTMRSRHTATLLPNGRVLILGGSQDGCCTYASSAELYY